MIAERWPKTASSVRTLTLPPVLLDVLHRHRAYQEEERDDAEDWEETGYVFVSICGTPLEPQNVVRRFKVALRKASLPETVRFHDLRHSCATLLIAQGIHLSVIKDILGHTQISTTANVYGHALPDMQRAATAKLGDGLGPQPLKRGGSSRVALSTERAGEEPIDAGEEADAGHGGVEGVDGCR